MSPEHPDTNSPAAPQEQRRLRATSTARPLNVVLVTPEIPPNTGNIARLCAATRAHLHLIHPLGFSIDEKAVRRAGLDYWPLVSVHEHANFEEFQKTLPDGARLHLFTGKAPRSYLQVRYQPSDYLIFGRESTGLPEDILRRYEDDLVAIPTLGSVRSLNLANAAAIAVYEALRQTQQLSDVHLQSVP